MLCWNGVYWTILIRNTVKYKAILIKNDLIILEFALFIFTRNLCQSILNIKKAMLNIGSSTAYIWPKEWGKIGLVYLH